MDAHDHTPFIARKFTLDSQSAYAREPLLRVELIQTGKKDGKT
jgi:hypothetical protein